MDFKKKRGIKMKNRILAVILTFTLVFGFGVTNVSAASMSIYPEQGSYEFEESGIGQKFVVDFMLSGNDGYNNSTFRVKYDPNVIRMVFNETSDLENDGFITYEVTQGRSRRLFTNREIMAQFAQVPSRRDQFNDYDGLADGSKTAAEIGIVKFGQLVRNILSKPYDIFEDGIFIRLTFEVVGSGETDIEIVPAGGSSDIIYATQSQVKDVDLVPAHVKVNGAQTETESTSESETETTKHSSSDDTENESESESESESEEESEIGNGNSYGNNNNDNDEDEDGKDNDENEDNGEEKGNQESSDSVRFTDLANYSWAEVAINALAEDNIINGVGNNRFAPADNIKRADFVIMLMNTIGIKTNDTNTGFSDVDPSKYYASAIKAAKNLGVALGDDKGNFRPEEFISRQDMMVLAYRALAATENSIENTDENALDKFGDSANVSAYAKEALNTMVSKKIVNGMGKTIEPKSNTTRAQGAVIIYNIRDIMK